jgi:CheY-like chemotaxis protein
MMTDKMPDSTGKAWFNQHLRVALGSLYDPSVLNNSPLLQLLGTNQQPDAVASLRQALTDAIESLRPVHNTPRGSKSSRVYEILRHRFIEQQTQCTVADSICLSIRQLQREEKTAVGILADTLWRVYQLEEKTQVMSAYLAPAVAPQAQAGWQEWDSLISTIPFQQSNIVDMVQDVVNTLKNVISAAHVVVDYRMSSAHSHLYLQAPILRQGLLNILSTAIEQAPKGKLILQTDIHPEQERIIIEAWSAAGKSASAPAACQENLDIAARLIQACKGSLQITTRLPEDGVPETGQPVFSASVTLSTAEQVIVLVIEDHPDTLQLYQRYLADSRYRFIGAGDIRQGLALAEEHLPQIILLDVMMPESDGWALLGQLRVHPKTHNIPVIICSIIPQSNLALTLGAAGFLRKPVSRADLLAALDHLLDQKPTKSG